VAVPPEYIVFDVDPCDGAKLEDLGDIPETVMARSGGLDAGWHVWFQLPEGVRPGALKGDHMPAVDIKKRGGYVVMPLASIHPAGATNGVTGAALASLSQPSSLTTC
jgi:hypothetical protein